MAQQMADNHQNDISFKQLCEEIDEMKKNASNIEKHAAKLSVDLSQFSALLAKRLDPIVIRQLINTTRRKHIKCLNELQSNGEN